MAIKASGRSVLTSGGCSTESLNTICIARECGAQDATRRLLEDEVANTVRAIEALERGRLGGSEHVRPGHWQHHLGNRGARLSSERPGPRRRILEEDSWKAGST